MDTATLLARLECPPLDEVLDVVIDSDAFNEIDDQYAIAYALRAPERFNVLAINAAPFFTETIPVIRDKASSPAEGMAKSYDEILRLLGLLGEERLREATYRGSESYLPDESTPVESDAARAIVRLALERPADDPLYVLATGAITNVASAILMEPSIVERIVVVWLGGQAFHWPDNAEFNLMQDVAAARVLFGCGCPVVLLPCKGVVSEFRVSRAELERYLKGKNEVCDYLTSITVKEAHDNGRDEYWSRTIWDVTPFAWLVNPDEFCYSTIEHSPIPEYDDHYSHDPRRHPIRYVYYVRRDLILEDLCRKLTR